MDTEKTKKSSVKAENSSKNYFDIAELAKDLNVSEIEVACVKRLKGWIAGKKVTKNEFEDALKELRTKPTGRGINR